MKQNSTPVRIGFCLWLTCSALFVNAQNVNIPDANFKSALVANTAINTNRDSQIQMSEASAFTGTMRVSNRNISDLTGIEAFTALTSLWCDNNNLTSLNLSANTALRILRCNHNAITALDVSNNTQLTDLRCYVNQIASLDVSANTMLSTLLVFQNKLTSFDVSANAMLTHLQCSFNQLSTLDVSANHQLTNLDARKNSLTRLNVRNGNNTAFTTFDVRQNPYLFCIQVDDPAWAEEHWILTDNNVYFSTDCEAIREDIVHIPDANFKSALLSNVNINRNNDAEIQVLEASLYTGAIKVFDRSIADLTGIEAFVNLTALECHNNHLTALDVSANTKLTALRCDHNDITSLDVSANTMLRDLRCYYNKLSTLDVGANTALNTLMCFGNQITSLDVSANTQLAGLETQHNRLTSLVLGNNTNLQTLFVHANQLTSVDVTGTPALTDLRVNVNKLTTLDLSANTQLYTLHAGDNRLTSLDLSNNTQLNSVRIYNNKLTSLDLTMNPALADFYAENNPFTTIDVRSGNNTTLTYFNTLNTPLLLCIAVDDPAWSEANWPLVDPASSFSENCDTGGAIVYIPDPNLKRFLLGVSDINRNGDSEIQVSEAQTFGTPGSGGNTLVIYDKNIYDATGMEAFINMRFLAMPLNHLTSIDVRPNTGLRGLDVGDNDITSLQFGTGLESLTVRHNQLTAIDLSNASGLLTLDVSYNPIGPVDVGVLTNLRDLGVAGTGLTSLDASANTNLTKLICDDNQLTSLDVSANVNLVELGCSGNQLSGLDLTANTALQWLSCNDNNITALNLSHLTELFFLTCTGNQITNLDVSNMPALQEVVVSNNKLTQLNVAGSLGLYYLQAGFNELTSFDPGGAQLDVLDLNDNKLTSLSLAGYENKDYYFWNMHNNPDLHCVGVTDVEFAAEYWTSFFDPGVEFSTDCGSGRATGRIAITVYPNPVIDKVTIDSQEPVEQVQVFDGVGGRLMDTQHGNSVDFSSYQTGLYLMNVFHGGKVSSVRVVKE